jgi:integrase
VTLRIEIRDPRIGRLSIQAGTDDVSERDARRATLLQLLESERGLGIIQRLRERVVTIEEVHRAALAFDLSSLEVAAERMAHPPIGLGATIDAWLAYLAGSDKAAATIELYRSIANSLESHFGVIRVHGEVVQDKPISDIASTEGEQWLTGRKATTGRMWSPRTQTVAHSLAAQIWDRAITEDEERAERTGSERTIRRNFWRREGSRRGVRAARIRKTRKEFLRRKDAAKLLRAIKGSPQAAWIAVGIYAGLRGGEAANLRVGIDLDLDAGVIRIQPRTGEHAWRTKTDNSVRNVPIHPRLARWLRAHIRAGYAGTRYVFRQPGKDAPISRGAWRVWTMTAFDAAKIRYGRKKDALVYHSLRHTFASWLTMEDVHPLKISKLMGDEVSQVIRTYSHLLDENLEEAIRRL